MSNNSINMPKQENHKCHKHHKTPLEIYEDTHDAQAFVVNCIDYRVIDNMITFLQAGPLAESYDLTSVAGASLGYNQKKYPHWTQTVLDQIKLGIELHHINQIIVFDHMDCGAYKLFYPDLGEDPEEERKLHIINIRKFIHKLRKLFPDFTFKGYLQNFEGEPELIYPKNKD